MSPTGEENPCQLGWYEVKSYYDYYSEFSGNSNPSAGADSNRSKNQSNGQPSPWWWTRSPFALGLPNWIGINKDGKVDGYGILTDPKDISPCVVIA